MKESVYYPILFRNILNTALVSWYETCRANEVPEEDMNNIDAIRDLLDLYLKRNYLIEDVLYSSDEAYVSIRRIQDKDPVENKNGCKASLVCKYDKGTTEKEYLSIYAHDVESALYSLQFQIMLKTLKVSTLESFIISLGNTPDENSQSLIDEMCLSMLNTDDPKKLYAQAAYDVRPVTTPSKGKIESFLDENGTILSKRTNNPMSNNTKDKVMQISLLKPSKHQANNIESYIESKIYSETFNGCLNSVNFGLSLPQNPPEMQ